MQRLIVVALLAASCSAPAADLPAHEPARLQVLPTARPTPSDVLAASDLPEHEPDPAADVVAWGESRNRNVHNPRSTASGYWQFLDSTWEWVTGLQPPAAAWPRDVQEDAFWTLWDGGAGASHWRPSRSCWAPLLDD